MFTVIVLVWVLITLHAPAWCYVLLGVGLVAETVRNIIRQKNTR